jgi:hypothetical protein
MGTHPEERMLASYEWVIETCTADEHEDIIDLSHATALREYDPQELRDALANIRYEEPGHGKLFTRLALMRDTGNQVAGLVDRQYAYVDDEACLPHKFDGGATVPKRFMAELYKATKASADR